MLMKKPAIVCFYIPPITLEIYISQRTTRDITNVLETMIKPWCLSHCRHVVKRDYLQFPYLQWNIEGKLFLLHTKRLNTNAKKFRTNLSCWIRFLTQTLLLTSYKSWKESNVHLLEIQTEKDATWPITRLTKWRSSHMTSASRLIGLLSYDDHFPFFTKASLLFFISKQIIIASNIFQYHYKHDFRIKIKSSIYQIQLFEVSKSLLKLYSFLY